jgi:Pyruvate/2-oxoacid:ferredoxin oxidoreductase delta subunit
MTEKSRLGPDPRQSYTYQELPIGSTIIGIEPEMIHTGSWRFYRPIFAPAISPCQYACPVGVDVGGFISMIKKKRFEEAYLRYMEENPFPGICGRMCNGPCEKACNRKELDSFVSVRALERFIADNRRPLSALPSDPESEKKKIAIVGASLSGFSCGYFLMQLGYKPIVFRRDAQLDGRMKEHPDYNLFRETIDQEIQAIVHQGLIVKTGKWDWDDLKKSEAVFVSTYIQDKVPASFSLPLQAAEDGTCNYPVGETGLFAGGEFYGNSQTIVDVIGDGKLAAMAIDSYVRKKHPALELKKSAAGGKHFLSFRNYRTGKNEKDAMKRVACFADLNPSLLLKKSPGKALNDSVAEKKVSFDNLQLTIPRESAHEEALRCFECGTCNSCGRCILYCPEGVINQDSSSSKTMEIDYAFCKGCGICLNECPKGMFILEREESEWE